MPTVSNRDEVEAWVKSMIIDAMDLTQNNLGEDICNRIADQILVRTLDNQSQPDGEPLAANQGRYGEKKRGKGLPVGIGLIDGGEMLSIEQLRGEQSISPSEATMIHGTNEDARNKGVWFTNGYDDTEPPRPPRPFFDMDESTVDDIMENVVKPHLESYLGGL